MSDLIKTSKRIFDEIDFERLRKHGIYRDRKEYEFIVTYPAIAAHHVLSQDDIFSNLDKDREIQFYVHIPFCTGICSYCARFTKLKNQPHSTVKRYVDYLQKELDMMLSIPELSRMKVDTLYIGGGTPTYLTAKMLDKLTSMLVSELNIHQDAEFSVEGSPETIKQNKLDVLKKNRVNRISMGIQSYDDDVLKLCNRRHNSKTAKLVSDMIVSNKFENYNIDLILGLPLQSLDKWEYDLKTAASSGATSVTIASLSTTSYSDMIKLSDDLFPSAEDMVIMDIMAKELFSDLGYEQNPVHFFNAPGTKTQIQTINKWKSFEMIGLGISTYQYMNNFQYHNHFDIKKYENAIDQGRLPIYMGIELEKEEQMARVMIFGMKRGRVDKVSFKNRFGVQPEEAFADVFESLYKLGLIEIGENEIKLSYTGFLFSEEVATMFFSKKMKEIYGKTPHRYSGYSIERTL